MDIQIPVDRLVQTYKQIVADQAAQIGALTERAMIAEMQVREIVKQVSELHPADIETDLEV